MDFMTFFIFILCISSRCIIIQAQQLDCNFDRGDFCNWANALDGTEDDFDWQIGSSVAVDGFHSIPRTVTGTGTFAFAQGKFRPTATDSAKAWLRSQVIDGQPRPATLSFNFWKTAAPPSLMICTRDVGVNQPRCVETISGLGEQQWVRHVATIPANTLQFQIIIVATNFRTALDLIGLDDIQYRMNFDITNSTLLNADADTQHVKKALSKQQPHVHRRNDYSKYWADALDESARNRGAGVVGREPTTKSPHRASTNESSGHRTTTEESESTTEEPIRALQVVQQQQTPYQHELQNQERLFELRQRQQSQQFQQSQLAQQQLSQQRSINQQPIPPAPAFPVQPGIGRNFQIVDSSLPPLPPAQNPPNFVIPPLPTIGPPTPFLVPSSNTESAFFGPPLPPLPPLPREPPVERSEPDIDAFIPSTQIISLFFQRTTPANLAQKFTLPPSWFRTSPNNNNRNDLDDQQVQSVAFAPQFQAPEVNTSSTRGHDHQQEHAHAHEHNHEHEFGVCQAVACKFDASLCSWYNDLNANFDWKIKNNHSQYQGIPQDFSGRSSYLFVSGDQRRPDQRAVVRSPPFVAPSGAYLEFYSFTTDPTVTRLSAYRNIGNDQPNVLWQTLGNGQVDKNAWQRVRVPLPASSFPMTLSIVADQLSTGQYIGIDDLRLVDNDGVDVGCASDTPFTNLGSTRAVLLTPFPPKEDDDSLQRNLQLSPVKAAALLNNPGQEQQVQQQVRLPALNASSSFPLPNSFLPPTSVGITVNPLLQQTPFGNQPQTAFIQQRRIGVIETQGSFGGDPLDNEVPQQNQQPNGALISSIDRNGQRKGLLQSIERQSPQLNVFQPARPDQLPREIIFATQLLTTPSALVEHTSPDFITTASNSPTILPSPALRSVDPVFPPGDSPEITDQDTFHSRRRIGTTRNTATLRGQLTRTEPNDDTTTVQSLPTSTTNPDPLGFQDFVSSLTRDLQVLAGGGIGTFTSPWLQSGSSLSTNFNQRGTPASFLQPQPSDNANWLQSLLGKKK